MNSGGLRRREPHCNARAEEASDLKPGMIRRNSREREMMRIDRDAPVRFRTQKKDARRDRINLLNLHPFKLNEAVEGTDRDIQIASEMRPEKTEDFLDFAGIADVHRGDYAISGQVLAYRKWR